MKKLITFFTAIVSSIACGAQQSESVQKTFQQDPVNHPLFPTFAVGVFGIVVALLLFAVGIYLVQMIMFMKKEIRPLPKVVARPIVKAPGKQKRFSGI